PPTGATRGPGRGPGVGPGPAGGVGGGRRPRRRFGDQRPPRAPPRDAVADDARGLAAHAFRAEDRLTDRLARGHHRHGPGDRHRRSRLRSAGHLQRPWMRGRVCGHLAQPVPAPLLDDLPQPGERRRAPAPSAFLSRPRHPAGVLVDEAEPPVEAAGRLVGRFRLEERRVDPASLNVLEQPGHQRRPDATSGRRDIDLVQQGVLAARLDAPTPGVDSVALPRIRVGDPHHSVAVVGEKRREGLAGSRLGELVAVGRAEAPMHVGDPVEVVGSGAADGVHAARVSPHAGATCQYRPVAERTIVYTDGACLGNPGKGGWAWLVPDGPYASGAEQHTTNQRMELTAVLEALKTVEGPVEVISDSAYVVNCFRDRWWEGW